MKNQKQLTWIIAIVIIGLLIYFIFFKKDKPPIIQVISDFIMPGTVTPSVPLTPDPDPEPNPPGKIKPNIKRQKKEPEEPAVVFGTPTPSLKQAILRKRVSPLSAS